MQTLAAVTFYRFQDGMVPLLDSIEQKVRLFLYYFARGDELICMILLGCYKFDPVRSFQFYPYSSSIGSVKAVYYMNPTCSGSSAIPIYGNQDAAFVPKEQVSSTGCFNATVFLKPYNITAETGVLYPFARFYTSYSVGGNKYGQTPVSAQTATTTTKASSNGNSNSPSSARSLIAPPSIFLVFAAVFALLSL